MKEDEIPEIFELLRGRKEYNEIEVNSDFVLDEPGKRVMTLFMEDAKITGAIIGDQPRRTSMEEKIVKWFKEHRRDILVAGITALVTAKLVKGGKMITVEKDGFIFTLPKEMLK